MVLNINYEDGMVKHGFWNNHKTYNLHSTPQRILIFIKKYQLPINHET